MQPTLAILGLGGQELLIIGVVALLFFGTRLPKLARSLGQSVNEFKGGLKDTSDSVKAESAESASE